MKKIWLAAAVAFGVMAGPALAQYPNKEIQGVIQWGAGGSTDVVSRSVTPHAEAVLGGKVVLQNVTGGNLQYAAAGVAASPANAASPYSA